MTKYIKEIFNSINKRGLINTIRFIFYEILFELNYKTDTIKEIELKDLTLVSQPTTNEADCRKYQAANYYIFKKVMKYVNFDPEESVFIDFGSGKGRVIIMAALNYKFEKIIGVEFGKELVKICNNNIKNIIRKLKTVNIQIINEDATKYTFPENTNLFFFNNPFSNDVLNKVIDNIEKSYQKNPRTIFIIYLNPENYQYIIDLKYDIYYCLKNKNKVEAIVLTKTL